MGNLLFNKLNKIYPNGFQAVYDFDLEIKDGEFVVLVGPSGCGKSTMLRMIAGLEDITGGELLLNGKKINDAAPVDRDIAVVFQDYALYSNLTVYNNIGMSMRLRHMDTAKIYDKVMDTSGFLGLDPLLNRMPNQLSGGQKQRVAVGRSITRHPEVFLMDEPLSNLDAQLRVTTRMEIVRIQKTRNITTVYVTHDQVEALTMADRIVVMKDGYIQQVGAPMDIYVNPANMFVGSFFGTPPMNFIHGKIAGDTFEFEEFKVKLPQNMADKLSAYNNKEVALGIRPENIGITKGGGGQIVLDVELVEFLGKYSYVFLKSAGCSIIVRVDASVEIEDKANVLLDFDAAHFFDISTTQRIT